MNYAHSSYEKVCHWSPQLQLTAPIAVTQKFPITEAAPAALTSLSPFKETA
jgi:hypothetical protein